MWTDWGWGRHPALPPVPVFLQCLAQALATGFHRFLARFSGRRRIHGTYHQKSPPPWLLLVLASTLFSLADACSSRTTPKPRPPAPTARPNITFHTYDCPPTYAAWYCLNGATCFTVKIGDSLFYNCECAEGYMGPRCEYKDLDGSYLPSQRRFMLETASIASGATIAVFLVVILCAAVYLNYKRRAKAVARGVTSDRVDGVMFHRSQRPPTRQPTFGQRWRPSAPFDLPLSATRIDGNVVDPKNDPHVELHQVTTLLDAPHPPPTLHAPTHARL